MKRLFDELAICAISEAENGSEQMAIDEALLHTCSMPTLRVYRWRVPEITFGYPMHWAEIETFARNRNATRRCTGGGIVEHGTDVTLCLAVPRSSLFSELPPVEIYRSIHDALLPAIPLRGAMLAPTGAAASQCFAGPSRHDIVSGDCKLAGGALRRTRDGLLYQGSLHVEISAGDIADTFGCTKTEWSAPDRWAGLVEELQRTRYGNSAWNRKR